MIDIDGDLFVGFGNRPANTDGACVMRVSSTGDIVAEHQLDEQGVIDMHDHGGKLYVPGCDPSGSDGWDMGNIYIRDAGAWTKRRTIPLAIHAWGACHDSNGDLWIACGCHAGDCATWEGRVMRSTNDGITWAENIQLTDYRVYDVAYFAGILYAVGFTGGASNLWSRDGSGVWRKLLDIYPYRAQRLTAFGGRLLTWKSMRQLIDCTSLETISTPFSRPDPVYNGMVSASGNLYVVDNLGYIWSTSDMQSWERYSYVAGAISIGYWPSQECLVVSDQGSNANLWRVPL